MKNSNTSLKIEDIINAIPDEINEEAVINDSLANLISKISLKKMPIGAITRMWILSSLQAKIAVGYIAYAIRSNFVNKTEKERILNETHLKAALKLLGTMGYLRGIIMKTGQLLGNLPHIVPNEIADIVSSLQFEAPPMHYSLIRELLLDEMGKDIFIKEALKDILKT
ncbi:hypothetical protein HZA55_07835 [Candidatus Poribacteria bacterium]|nr:hypothetical protein [Candidatus Poribacteria bacterium]